MTYYKTSTGVLCNLDKVEFITFGDNTIYFYFNKAERVCMSERFDNFPDFAVARDRLYALTQTQDQ